MRGASLVIALLIPVFTGCDHVTGPGSVPAGAYAYTGFDSRGAAVVKGWLVLNFPGGSKVTGAWHLDPVGDPRGIGPQIGDGELEGVVFGREGDAVAINLNPHYVDNNVGLTGILEGESFRGRWEYTGFPGPISSGTFEAVRR